MKLWCVKVAYYYGDESPQNMLECDVKLFPSKEEAVKELERIIRHEWTTEVFVTDEDKRKMLADCRGKSEQDSIKWSDWYYSEDGTLAWAYYGAALGYKGRVEEIIIDELPETAEPEKEATC